MIVQILNKDGSEQKGLFQTLRHYQNDDDQIGQDINFAFRNAFEFFEGEDEDESVIFEYAEERLLEIGIKRIYLTEINIEVL